MKIIQIYPFNNPVSKVLTKPVILAGKPYIEYSKYKKDIIILSSYTKTPLNDTVTVLNARNKKDYAKEVIGYISSLAHRPKIIEVHQDTKLAALLGKKFKTGTAVFLFKHSAGLYKRTHEKLRFIRFIYGKLMLSHLTYVFGVSNYVKSQLQSQFPRYADKFKTLYNTYGHLDLKEVHLEKPRNNSVLFVGRPMRIKGIFEFMRALSQIINLYNNWQGIVVSGFFSAKSKYKKDINALIEEPAVKQAIGNRKIILHQNLAIGEVFNTLQRVKIFVVPSMCQEGFGLTTLEAHVAGCIVITSGRGALPEISEQFAYYLKKVTQEEIVDKVTYVINNLQEALKMAAMGKQHVLNKFNPQKLVEEFDSIRARFM